ncbi:hypothetical protein [Asticcacaulis excentricus]|uniref:hypothetical protein n=1 Tax=Asticcacaulis excentricus TaxID=78587 RepID=UPI0001A78B21|nr:hypothetical protein [Asticcacaulis excentricus]
MRGLVLHRKSTLITAAGSAYTYTYSAIGEVAGWVVGWALNVEYSLACSSVAVGWSAHLVGWLNEGMGLQSPVFLLNASHAGDHVNLPAVLVSLAVMGLLMIDARESTTLITLIFVAILPGFVPLKEIAALSNAGTLIAFFAVSRTLARTFKTPAYLPIGLAAIARCAFIFCSLPIQSQLFTLIWMAICLVVYFSYGKWHIRLKRARERSGSVMQRGGRNLSLSMSLDRFSNLSPPVDIQVDPVAVDLVVEGLAR